MIDKNLKSKANKTNYEDKYFIYLVEKRIKENKKFYSHKEAWKKFA